MADIVHAAQDALTCIADICYHSNSTGAGTLHRTSCSDIVNCSLLISALSHSISRPLPRGAVRMLNGTCSAQLLTESVSLSNCCLLAALQTHCHRSTPAAPMCLHPNQEAPKDRSTDTHSSLHFVTARLRLEQHRSSTALFGSAGCVPGDHAGRKSRSI